MNFRTKSLLLDFVTYMLRLVYPTYKVKQATFMKYRRPHTQGNQNVLEGSTGFFEG